MLPRCSQCRQPELPCSPAHSPLPAPPPPQQSQPLRYTWTASLLTPKPTKSPKASLLSWSKARPLSHSPWTVTGSSWSSQRSPSNPEHTCPRASAPAVLAAWLSVGSPPRGSPSLLCVLLPRVYFHCRWHFILFVCYVLSVGRSTPHSWTTHCLLPEEWRDGSQCSESVRAILGDLLWMHLRGQAACTSLKCPLLLCLPREP